MKIAWHMPTLRRSGCGLSARARVYARRLIAEGHDVCFHVAADKTDFVDGVIDDFTVSLIPTSHQRPLHWSLQARTRGRIAREAVASIGIDHDLFISCQPEAVAACARTHPRKPLVFVCGGTTLLHDAADASNRRSAGPVDGLFYAVDRRLKRYNERAACRAADLVILNSLHTRRRLIDAYGLDERRAVAIHGGVDPERFLPPTAALRRAARNSLGIGDSEFVIAWTGRIAPEKNVRRLVAAVAEMNLRPDALLLAGDGPLRPAIEAQARRLGVESIVRCLGNLADVRPVLHAADVFAFPSRSESFGSSLVEAMACGLPVVALSPDGRRVCNAADEIIRDGRCGLVVPVDDAFSFAAAIDRLRADANLRRELGRAGRAHARANFNWEQAGNRFVEAVHHAAWQSRKPAALLPAAPFAEASAATPRG